MIGKQRQAAVLAALRSRGKMAASEIAQAIGCPVRQVRGAIEALRSQGLVAHAGVRITRSGALKLWQAVAPRTIQHEVTPPAYYRGLKW